MSTVEPKACMGDYIEPYLTRCLVENKTQQTVDSYRKTLRQWTASGLSPEVWLHTLSCGLLTRHKHFRHLRVFFNWLLAHKVIDTNPLAGVKMKRPKWLPKRVTAGEIRAMLASTRNPRDKIVMLLAADTALRSLEIARLRVEDVDLQNRTLRVWGKGDKPRIVRFGAETAKLLRVWANRRNTEEPLFPNRATGGRLTHHAIRLIFHRAAKRAKLDLPRGSHSFRHYAASKILEMTGDLELVRSLLGHETLSTTLLYVKMLGMSTRKYRSPVDEGLT